MSLQKDCPLPIPRPQQFLEVYRLMYQVSILIMLNGAFDRSDIDVSSDILYVSLFYPFRL